MEFYEFKHSGGEKDWVFAPGIKEAREFYLKETGCGDLEGCMVKPIPKKQWKSTYILDIESPEPDEDEEYNEDDYYCGYKIQETFAQYAENNTQTDLVATTEF